MEKFPLPCSIPENLGIPSDAILNFINHLEEQKLCVHTFMFIRHGEIAAEGYYPPFTPDRLKRMYSTSKTFVAMAVGLLIGEGKISLDDKVAGFFPEHCPADMHDYLANSTIRDLLKMESPHTHTTYGDHDENWTWTFLNRKPTHPPGTIFNYDTSATVMLNAIVEKVSGSELMAYMRPRLFDHIGISDAAHAIQRPEGGAWGGSGVLCSTHDLAKFALVLLNNGKGLIPEWYVKEATSALIDNRATTDKPELQFGYGYQIWRTRNNGFATIGMGSQFAVCVPDKDFIFIITADTQSVPGAHNTILELMWNDVYNNISDTALPENKSAYDNLSAKLNNLKFLPVDGNTTSAVNHSGKYKLLDNPINISDIEFDFTDKSSKMLYTNRTGNHVIEFGFGDYVYGEFPETHYYGDVIGTPKGSGYEYKASAAWFDDNNLTIYLYAIGDYLGTLKITVSFKDNGITIHMSSFAEWFFYEYNGYASGYLV